MRCEVCGCSDAHARWLRVSDVARQLRCSSKKVRRLIKTGELEGARLGATWLVDHRFPDQYLRRDSVRFSVS
ncbi:MAG: helix-turn-helix domain-containing protein, partial [Planctomycetes bacterium]|nr:helix-turn-helix domain-containing protein [Planctomycetota bacterium]